LDKIESRGGKVKKYSKLFLISTMLIISATAFSQIIKLKVMTARGKNIVFADTVFACNMKSTLANWNGYFRVEFKEKGFEGAFNIPLDFQGTIGVDERAQMSYQRKDAHFFGVITVNRESGDLILLTKSPKDEPEMESTIINGIWSSEKVNQLFKGTLIYRTYTYDESKFQKRNFIIEMYLELPFKITWGPLSRSWVPESLPDPLVEPADSLNCEEDKILDAIQDAPEGVLIEDSLESEEAIESEKSVDSEKSEEAIKNDKSEESVEAEEAIENDKSEESVEAEEAIENEKSEDSEE